MAYYRNDERTNYFIEFGSGRPVVLLHGISNSGRAWGPQIPPLVRAGFRVIVPDHAGHGASQPVRRTVTVADIAADVLALLDHLQIGRADIVGLSLGGMAALQLALDEPERVSRLIVANSFDSWVGDDLAAMAKGWASIFRGDGGPVDRLERTWPMLVSETFQTSDQGLQTYQVWHGIAATVDGPALANVAEGIIGFDVAARLPALLTPALFIAGERDLMSVPAISRRMAARAPHASYVELAGASHLSNVDSAELFNRALLAFLQDSASEGEPAST